MKIDIQEIINAKIKDMEEKRVIETTIENTVEKTIVKAVTDALESYSLKRDIQDKVEEQVSSVVSTIGFSGYNSFIAAQVKKITEEALNNDLAEKIQNTFNEILIMRRDSVKLSEICDLYRKCICEELDEQEKYDLENFYVSVEDACAPYNWLTFKFGKEAKSYSSSFNEEVKFTIHRNKDKTTGWMSSVYIDGNSIEDKIKFGNMNKVERLLVNIAYNKTPIIIDVESEDDIDNSFDIDN